MRGQGYWKLNTYSVSSVVAPAVPTCWAHTSYPPTVGAVTIGSTTVTPMVKSWSRSAVSNERKTKTKDVTHFICQSGILVSDNKLALKKNNHHSRQHPHFTKEQNVDMFHSSFLVQFNQKNGDSLTMMLKSVHFPR